MPPISAVTCSSGRACELLQRLRRLAGESPLIGDVRGVGLMLAAGFVGPGTKGPNSQAVQRILKRALENALLMYPCGHRAQTIRLVPPLNVTGEQVGEGLAIFREAVLSAR